MGKVDSKQIYLEKEDHLITRIKPPTVPLNLLSDDFNACSANRFFI